MINKEKSNNITLLIAGDLIPPERSRNIFSRQLREILKDKDFSIVNLEAPLTKSTKSIIKTGNNFKVSPEMIHHIKNGYFDAVTISNNHIQDFGDEGIRDTIEICERNEILIVGAGANLNEASKPLRVFIKNNKISFLNYSEKEFNTATESKAGANPFDIIDTYNQLKSEKEENDYVIIIYHGGLEYHHLPPPELVKTFKFLIENGADCIVSHHTHRYSGLMYHKNKPILFGLGNLFSVTKNKSNEGWHTGIIAKIGLGQNDIPVELIPTKIENDFSGVGIMSDSNRNMVLNHISEISGIISCEKSLQKYWEAESKRMSKKILSVLNSNSLIEYRIRKNLPGLSKSPISDYKLLNILNLIRCFSHRERLITILEYIYKEKTK